MKKIWLNTLLVGLLMSVSSSLMAADPVPLMAGKDWQAGVVHVWNDATTLYVQYELNAETLDAGWCLTETHLHVGQSLDDFPINKGGNPKVGQFDFGSCYECVMYSDVYEIPLGELVPGDSVMIAAHATVQQEVCTEVEPEVYDCITYMESAWAAGDRFTAKGNWATYFTYVVEAVNEPVCELVLDVLVNGTYRHRFTFYYNDLGEIISAVGEYRGMGAEPDEMQWEESVDMGSLVIEADFIDFMATYENPGPVYSWNVSFINLPPNGWSFIGFGDGVTGATLSINSTCD